MYTENYGDTFDKRFTKKVKFVIGYYVNVAMDNSPVERGSAQLDITDYLFNLFNSALFLSLLDITDDSESSAGDGTLGRSSAVEKGLVTGYKRLRSAERLLALATECTSVKRKKGTGSGSHEKRGSVTRKI